MQGVESSSRSPSTAMLRSSLRFWRGEGDPALAIHLYQSDPEAAIDESEAQWHKANPGIEAGVKSLDVHGGQKVRRVAVTVSDRTIVRRRFDMNLPQSRLLK